MSTNDGYCTCNGPDSGGRMGDCGIAAHRIEWVASRADVKYGRAALAGWAADRAETTTATATLMARRGGKTQALIESLLAQAGERGLTVEVVYPETTTATTEDAAQVLDDVIQHLRRIWSPAVDYGDEHEVIDTAEVLLGQALPGLLATARTRPTREALIEAIGHDGDWCKRERGELCCDAPMIADRVLALWADQPTEAEAGAQALEQAAEALYADDGPNHPLSAATWLRERAARLRAGGDDQ